MRSILEMDRGQAARAALPISRRIERAADWRPAFDKAHREFLTAQRAQYATGSVWRPDLPQTVAQKARHGGSGRTLTDSGRLARSLTATGPEHVYRTTRDSAEMGTTVPYARYVKAAGRAPVVVTAALRGAWLRIVRQHLAGGR